MALVVPEGCSSNAEDEERRDEDVAAPSSSLEVPSSSTEVIDDPGPTAAEDFRTVRDSDLSSPSSDFAFSPVSTNELAALLELLAELPNPAIAPLPPYTRTGSPPSRSITV